LLGLVICHFVTFGVHFLIQVLITLTVWSNLMLYCLSEMLKNSFK